MKIYNRLVIDIKSGIILEEDSFEYEGPIMHCLDDEDQDTQTVIQNTFTEMDPVIYDAIVDAALAQVDIGDAFYDFYTNHYEPMLIDQINANRELTADEKTNYKAQLGLATTKADVEKEFIKSTYLTRKQIETGKLKNELLRMDDTEAAKNLEAQIRVQELQQMHDAKEMASSMWGVDLSAQESLALIAEMDLRYQTAINTGKLQTEEIDKVKALTGRTQAETDRINAEIDLIAEQVDLTDQQAIRTAMESGLISNQAMTELSRKGLIDAQTLTEASQRGLIDAQQLSEFARKGQIDADTMRIAAQTDLLDEQALTESVKRGHIEADTAVQWATEGLISEQKISEISRRGLLDAQQIETLAKANLLDEQAITQAVQRNLLTEQAQVAAAQAGLITEQTATELMQQGKLSAQTQKILEEVGLVTAQTGLTAEQTGLTAEQRGAIAQTTAFREDAGMSPEAKAATQEYYKEVLRAAEPEFVEGRVKQARADIGEAFAGEEGRLRRGLGRMGIDPTSARGREALKTRGLERAKGIGLAETQARRAAEAEKRDIFKGAAEFRGGLFGS